ncbi:MAG TPA: hypothetical protein VF618_13970 [Thermoanaerobaculia bacterium]
MASPSLVIIAMTKYDKELDTRTDEYEEAMKPKRSDAEVRRELHDTQKGETPREPEEKRGE